MNRSEKFWDKTAGTFDNRVAKFDQSYAIILETIKKHITTGDVVLDFGCGTGTVSCEIAGCVKEIHAIDISSGMIKVAREKTAEQKIENIHFTQTTLFDQSFQKGFFDVILAINILHLLKSPYKAVQRINELLIPGGVFVSSTACLGEKISFSTILFILRRFIGTMPYLKVFKIPAVEDLISGGDFHIVNTEKLVYTPPNYLVVAKKIQLR